MEKMTLREYRIRMKAHYLNQEAEEYDRHWRAWLNWNVQGTKKQGKSKIVPIYRMFKEFYDREKALKGEKVATEEDQRIQKMKAAAKKRAERRENNGNV